MTNNSFMRAEDVAEVLGITETLKAKNQMLWVGMMNNIKNQAEEIVYKKIVYNRIAMK